MLCLAKRPTVPSFVWCIRLQQTVVLAWETMPASNFAIDNLTLVGEDQDIYLQMQEDQENNLYRQLAKLSSGNEARSTSRSRLCFLIFIRRRLVFTYFSLKLHTALDPHTFCIWLFFFGILVDRWWSKKVWYVPDLFDNVFYSCAPYCCKNNKKYGWKIFPWHASQKTRSRPTCGRRS